MTGRTLNFTAAGITAVVTAAIGLVGAAGLVHADTAAAEPTAEVVQNGSFEYPTAPTSGVVGTFPAIPGWTETTGRGMEVQNGLYDSAPGGGAQYVELNSNGPSSFYQDVPTVAGRSYRLEFRYTARPDTLPEENAFEVTFGETTQSIALAPVTEPEWQASMIDIAATQPVTRLTFSDATSPPEQRGLGALLDLVSVVPLT